MMLVDLVALAAVLLSILRGVYRGAWAEIVGAGVWLGGLAIAALGSSWLPRLGCVFGVGLAEAGVWCLSLSFGGIFVVTAVALRSLFWVFGIRFGSRAGVAWGPVVGASKVLIVCFVVAMGVEVLGGDGSLRQVVRGSVTGRGVVSFGLELLRERMQP